MPRHRNKKQNSFKCYIRNQTDDSADIYFYGDIVGNDGDKWWGNDDKCPSDVATLLKECENVSQLNIYVNSNGGDVFAGNAIYNMLKRHKDIKQCMLTVWQRLLRQSLLWQVMKSLCRQIPI